MSINRWRLLATTIATAGLLATGMGSTLAAPLPEPECTPDEAGGERCLAFDESYKQRTNPGDVTVLVHKYQSEFTWTDANGETLAEEETRWNDVSVLKDGHTQAGHVTIKRTSEFAGSECHSNTSTTVARDETRHSRTTNRCR